MTTKQFNDFFLMPSYMVEIIKNKKYTCGKNINIESGSPYFPNILTAYNSCCFQIKWHYENRVKHGHKIETPIVLGFEEFKDIWENDEYSERIIISQFDNCIFAIKNKVFYPSILEVLQHPTVSGDCIKYNKKFIELVNNINEFIEKNKSLKNSISDYNAS